MKFSTSSVVIFIIAVCFLFLIKCINKENDNATDAAHSKYMQYAGSASCASCHKDIHQSFIHTGHFLTSTPGIEKNIKGSFKKDSNIYWYNPKVFISMEKSDSGLYEIEHEYGTKSIIGRFDVVVGSGIRGQTYLTWRNNSLFQLPVSYLSSVNEWVNAPGANNSIITNRVIDARCLECHSTFANNIAPTSGAQPEFARNQIIYGISCEKCHGPGKEHVDYQTEHPKDKTARYIVNPGTFSRQESLSLCRLCHGGRMHSIKPSFSFTSGDKLENYFATNTSKNNANIDVHGNQFGLLSKSKCFTATASLTCLSCHSPHDNERGNLTLFSQRCMSCHNQEHGTFCKIKSVNSAFISSNCIDCHMPAEESKLIVMNITDSTKTAAALLRTHYITIYPDATKKYLASKIIRKNNK